MTAARAPKGAWQPVKEHGHPAVNGARAPLDLARGYLPILVVCMLLGFTGMVAYQAGSVLTGYAMFQTSTAARFTAIELQLVEISKTLAQIRDQQLQATKK